MAESGQFLPPFYNSIKRGAWLGNKKLRGFTTVVLGLFYGLQHSTLRVISWGSWREGGLRSEEWRKGGRRTVIVVPFGVVRILSGVWFYSLCWSYSWVGSSSDWPLLRSWDWNSDYLPLFFLKHEALNLPELSRCLLFASLCIFRNWFSPRFSPSSLFEARTNYSSTEKVVPSSICIDFCLLAITDILRLI